MKQWIRKVILYLTVLAVCISSFGAISVQGAESYRWYGPAWTYDTPDEARNYDMNEENRAGVAVGGYIYLKYGSDYEEETEDCTIEYQWSASNSNVRVDVQSDQTSAKIIGNRVGTARVTVTAIYKKADGTEENQRVKTMDLQVTNPRLKNSKIGLVIYNEAKIELTGNSSYGADHILYAADRTSNFYVSSGGYVSGYAKQTRKVFVFVDGITLTAYVKCTNPSIREGYVVQKGKSVSYKVRGASGYTPVTYKAGNSKYASVSKSGTVKGRRYGKTSLTIKVDGATAKFDVYVVKANAYKAVTKAQSICKSKPKYSQKKRMKKGYVDCSSFVWKAYKSGKVNFGSKSYAPTAADIAKWCSKKKKLLKLSSYNKKSAKLKPGDLIFYKKRSGKNGRYKNIDHVAMYIGNDTIVHADGRSVSYSYPWYRKAAAIARPVK